MGSLVIIRWILNRIKKSSCSNNNKQCLVCWLSSYQFCIIICYTRLRTESAFLASELFFSVGMEKQQQQHWNYLIGQFVNSSFCLTLCIHFCYVCCYLIELNAWSYRKSNHIPLYRRNNHINLSAPIPHIHTVRARERPIFELVFEEGTSMLLGCGFFVSCLGCRTFWDGLKFNWPKNKNKKKYCWKYGLHIYRISTHQFEAINLLNDPLYKMVITLTMISCSTYCSWTTKFKAEKNGECTKFTESNESKREKKKRTSKSQQ